MYNILHHCTGHGTLRILHLGGNVFGDDGMQLLMEKLQGNNMLVDLAIWNCGLSTKGKILNM